MGGVSDCGFPVCCKRGLGNPIRGQDSGSWGDYNCDIPPWLFVNTLNYINNTHKVCRNVGDENIFLNISKFYKMTNIFDLGY